MFKNVRVLIEFYVQIKAGDDKLLCAIFSFKIYAICTFQIFNGLIELSPESYPSKLCQIVHELGLNFVPSLFTRSFIFFIFSM